MYLSLNEVPSIPIATTLKLLSCFCKNKNSHFLTSFLTVEQNKNLNSSTLRGRLYNSRCLENETRVPKTSNLTNDIKITSSSEPNSSKSSSSSSSFASVSFFAGAEDAGTAGWVVGPDDARLHPFSSVETRAVRLATELRSCSTTVVHKMNQIR